MFFYMLITSSPLYPSWFYHFWQVTLPFSSQRPLCPEILPSYWPFRVFLSHTEWHIQKISPQQDLGHRCSRVCKSVVLLQVLGFLVISMWQANATRATSLLWNHEHHHALLSMNCVSVSSLRSLCQYAAVSIAIQSLCLAKYIFETFKQYILTHQFYLG